MSEYADIIVYIERLDALATGQTLEQIRFAGLFCLLKPTTVPDVKPAANCWPTAYYPGF